MKILILGAGPCGLGAAYHLNKLGYSDWALFDKSDHVGGLSASFRDDKGFTWDIGGHVLFSHYDYFDKAVEESLGDSYFEHQRESWIRILQRWVPYPFQNNVRYLPDDVLQECINGLRSLQGTQVHTANFYDWMHSVFGSGIVKYFMEPYNRKVWGVPLQSMSKEWIAERVSLVDISRIERNISEQRDDLSWGPNAVFRFPEHGGTGAIYQGIARKFSDRIHLDHEMVTVDVIQKEVCFSNGRIERYDYLLNTSPLDLFVDSCTSLPFEIKEASEKLVHNSGLIVGLGFKGERVDPKCWMYFPESSSPFYRVTNFHNYSPNNVPESVSERYFSLMCETTYSEHKPVSEATVVEATLQGLIETGMISNKERDGLVSSYLINIPYSYPVPELGRDRALGSIQPYLESKDIYSRGRFGGWKYEEGNMDHSFMQGVQAVDSMVERYRTK